MASIVANIKKYDWDTWLMGIFRSVIQGGASGVTGGVSAMSLDPVKFNLAQGLGKTAEMFAMTFVLGSIFSMMTFLKTHDGPDPEETASA